MASNLLDDLTIRAQKPKSQAYTLRDGNGLFLLVHPNGSKYFQLRATLHGKSKLVRLGVYPNLSLSEARIKSVEAIKLIEADLDPTIEKKIVKAKAKASAEATFKSVALSWLEIKQKTLAKSTHLKIKQTFNANVYARIGAYPIGKIDNIMVRDCLLIMQKRGSLEYMDKTRGWIKQVFDFALADLLITENPIPVTDLRLSKHVGKKYPSLKSTNDAGKLLRNLNDYAGSFEVLTCVYLTLNFAQRPSELRCAKWVDFDFEKAIWTIPLAQSKTRLHMPKPQSVMLSRQAIGALMELRQYTGHGEYVFPGRLNTKPVSEATIRKAFRQVFIDYHIVPHGCRHFFSTQANESGLFRPDVIEAALSHKDANKIRAVYNEATYDRERKELAQWWSDQLDIMREGAKVILFKTAT